MITIRRSEERGHRNHGWLDTHHTFSFASYHDAAQMQFRSLRVINEDRVLGGQGFGKHPHRNMEIISYVVSGILEHQDSMGNRAVMKAGDVQRISAGTGIEHSEYNGSPIEPVHFLQIWILPDEQGVTPRYGELSTAAMKPGTLHLIASKQGRDHSLSIHQDADVYVARLNAGAPLEHVFADGRAGWVQMIEGSLTVNGELLRAGDGASITDVRELSLVAAEDAHFLLFDLS
ncbi:MAG: pirin family protein [Bryobacterales bacterium]|nr:pirin family protein [Bryobacterales bacterium]